MTKNKIVEGPIVDERKRNFVLTKRAESMAKKCYEIEELCGIEAALVVHKEGENNAVFYPSQEVFGERLQKYLDFNETERNRKMVTHEQYLEKRVSEESEHLANFKQANDLKESKLLMNGVIKGKTKVNELDMNQANLLHNFATEMLKKLQAREEELKAGPVIPQV